MNILFRLLISIFPVPLIFSLSFAVTAPPAPAGQAKARAAVPAVQASTAAARGEIPNDAPGLARGDFDEFNSLNDPLSREAAKAFLKAVLANDDPAKAVPVLRDAPADTGAAAEVKKQTPVQRTKPVIKKRKTGKFLHIDPLKSDNTI